jgi:hypothetical protein
MGCERKSAASKVPDDKAIIKKKSKSETDHNTISQIMQNTCPPNYGGNQKPLVYKHTEKERQAQQMCEGFGEMRRKCQICQERVFLEPYLH